MRIADCRLQISDFGPWGSSCPWRVWRRSGFLEFPSELVGGEFDFAQDLAYERAGEVSAGVLGDGCCSAVGVPIEDVASFLTDGFKAQVEKDSLHCPEVDDGEPRHRVTSIC